jgi:hypothetical protein
MIFEFGREFADKTAGSGIRLQQALQDGITP